LALLAIGAHQTTGQALYERYLAAFLGTGQNHERLGLKRYIKIDDGTPVKAYSSPACRVSQAGDQLSFSIGLGGLGVLQQILSFFAI